METFDKTDLSFDPCECSYRICLWCVHRLRSEGQGCPACRRPFCEELQKRPAVAAQREGVCLQGSDPKPPSSQPRPALQRPSPRPPPQVQGASTGAATDTEKCRAHARRGVAASAGGAGSAAARLPPPPAPAPALAPRAAAAGATVPAALTACADDEDPELAHYLWSRERQGSVAGAALATALPVSSARGKPPKPGRQRALVAHVAEMGFGEAEARRALAATGWAGVEEAVAALLDS